MALVRIDRLPDYKLGIWKIEESLCQLISNMEIPSHIAASIEGYTHEARKIEKLTTYRLLEAMIGHNSVEILHQEDGAPYLSDRSSHISISHTKGYIAILLHANSKVGIDIEYIHDRIHRVKQRFLHLKELESIDPEHSTQHLLLYWSMKECLFKALNERDIDFSQELYIAPFSLTERGVTTGRFSRGSSSIDLPLYWQLEQEYVLTFTLAGYL